MTDPLEALRRHYAGGGITPAPPAGAMPPPGGLHADEDELWKAREVPTQLIPELHVLRRGIEAATREPIEETFGLRRRRRAPTAQPAGSLP